MIRTLPERLPLDEPMLFFKKPPLKTGLSILVVAAVVLTGCTYWIGLAIEELAQQPQSGMEITHLRRGWFRSEAHSRVPIEATATALSEQGLLLHHTVYHGPLPLNLSGWPAPALATIETTLAPDLLRRLDVFEVRAGQQLLTVSSRIAFDQSIRHRLHVAPTRLSAPRGRLDHLALSALDGWLQVSADGQPTAGELAIADLQFANRADAVSFELERLDLALEQITGPYYRLQLDTALKRLHLRRQAAGPGQLRLSIEKLDHQALTQLLRTAPDDPDQIMRLQALLRHQPRIVLNRLQLQTTLGPLRAEADLTLREFSLLQLIKPLGLLGAALLRADVDISIARGLLESAVSEQQISQWRAAGFIRLDDETYHSRIQLHDEQLSINTTPVVLP
jgi:uncharacterized protein YdgA (DUF945 family)